MDDEDERRLRRWILTERRNVFVTGGAGTGKSHTLRRILHWLPAEGTCVTASTGIAAVHVAGTTLNAFAGIGHVVEPLEDVVRDAQHRRAVRERWASCRVLVVDEISMVSGAVLTAVDAVARAVRQEPDRAFGGVQVLCFGDFLQLPPVASLSGGERDYAFRTGAWAELRLAVHELTATHRQAEDPEFAALLCEARLGRLSCNAYLALRARASADGPPPEGAVRLRSHNRDVDAENERLFAALEGAPREYAALDAGPEPHRLAACAIPAQVALKVGTRVVLLANLLGADLANGDCGIVVRE